MTGDKSLHLVWSEEGRKQNVEFMPAVMHGNSRDAKGSAENRFKTILALERTSFPAASTTSATSLQTACSPREACPHAGPGRLPLAQLRSYAHPQLHPRGCRVRIGLVSGYFLPQILHRLGWGRSVPLWPRVCRWWGPQGAGCYNRATHSSHYLLRHLFTLLCTH